MDNYNRVFSYLRLSITDLCNFNCKYCLPDNSKFNKKSHLSLFEIKNLISAFSDLGISKIRLTGGEPTIRKDFLDIGNIISEHPSIKSLVFTTNGYRLSQIANEAKAVGFTGINVSLDSMDKKKFFLITNKNYFDDVIHGIFMSLELNFDIKINVVLSDFFSFFDFENFYSILKYKKIIIRFIDQMETSIIKKKSESYFTSFYLIAFLKKNGWIEVKNSDATAGPAIIFQHADFIGKIGFITPYSNSFCKTCNRLRISSTGDLFLCLFGGESFPIRSYLSSENKKEELIDFLLNTVKLKKISHLLHNEEFGLIKTFSSIGG